MAPETSLIGAPETARRRWLVPDRHVLAGLGILVALLAGAVGLAVFQIVRLEDDTTALTDRRVQYATSIHEAALNAKGIANNERGFLLSGNAEFVEELEARTVDARAAFVAARSYAVGREERAAADEARVGFERWLRAVRSELAAYRAGFEKRAIAASLGPTRDLRKSYEDSLARAHALGLRSIESASRSVSASASGSVTSLLVYLGLALVIGVGAALWVIRTILKPAQDLTQNALELLASARVLVEEGPPGSHHGVAIEVPLEAANALAENALKARDLLRAGSVSPPGDESS